jgi:hypothetical protein
MYRHAAIRVAWRRHITPLSSAGAVHINLIFKKLPALARPVLYVT